MPKSCVGIGGGGGDIGPRRVTVSCVSLDMKASESKFNRESGVVAGDGILPKSTLLLSDNVL